MTSLKKTGIAVGKVVFVAMGVPYGIAILINSVNGWPQSDSAQSRVCKQLRPSRVLSLNYAIWQQFTMVKWLPLLVRGKFFYGDADPSTKNIPFGENNLKMDIWLPKTKDDPVQERPVVFFIYGGAWGSGYKELYAKFGQELANNLKAAVVVPDYRTFPRGTMQDMVNDISDAVDTFRQLIKTSPFSADVSKLILIGHSAGAHLCTMAAIHFASKQLVYSSQKGSVVLKNGDFRSDVVEDQVSRDRNEKMDLKGNFDCELDIEKENCANNLKEQLVSNFEEGETHDDDENVVDLAVYVKGVIGIGGVYHIMDHYYHEAKRGVEDLSPMWRAAEGLQNFEKYSPTCIVPSLNDNETKRLPPHVLIHGMKDKTVPDSSSSKFAKILSEAGVPTTLKLIPEGGHADLVMDMMEPGRKWYSVMMGMVMEGTTSLLQNDSSI